VTQTSSWDSPEKINARLHGIGRWLIFFLFSALLIGGGQLISDPDQRWRIAGWACMLVAFPVIIATTNRWAKLLPVLFAYGAFHTAFASFEGHSATNLTPVSGFERIVVFLILAGCANLSIAFYKKRRLTIADRICVIAITILFTAGTSLEALRGRIDGRLTGASYYNDTVFIFSGILTCLIITWGYDHFHRSKELK
jgi:hypothetical protein